MPNVVCPKEMTHVPGGTIRYFSDYFSQITAKTTYVKYRVQGACIDKDPVTNVSYDLFIYTKYVISVVHAAVRGVRPPLQRHMHEWYQDIHGLLHGPRRFRHLFTNPLSPAYNIWYRGAKEYCEFMEKRLPTKGEWQNTFIKKLIPTIWKKSKDYGEFVASKYPSYAYVIQPVTRSNGTTVLLLWNKLRPYASPKTAYRCAVDPRRK